MITTNAPFTEKTNAELTQWLQSRLSEDRFLHSLGAQKKALELAQQFGLSAPDRERVSIASLLHDCAKLLSPSELIEQCRSHHIAFTTDEQSSPQTLHPFVGAEMVRRELGIEDEDLLNAIRYHTTGRASMSDVEKVVFIADKIEENTRNPLYTQKIASRLTGSDQDTLNQVVLYIMDSTITFLIEKRQIIHPRTLEARNYFLRHIKSQSLPQTRVTPQQ